MTDKDFDLEDAYGLRTREDILRYYQALAPSYDSAFAAAMEFRVPALVAVAYAALGGGPVLDVGAGTGLLGSELVARGVSPVDGIDLSPEMITLARAKGIYRALHQADVTLPLAMPDGTYAGCVSSGTFTWGHVGPSAFDELLRVVRPGGIFAVSVHSGVYEAAGFARRFAELEAQGRICSLCAEDIAFYGETATGPHAQDRGYVVTFAKS